jgi:hypothetical protein
MSRFVAVSEKLLDRLFAVADQAAPKTQTVTKADLLQALNDLADAVGLYSPNLPADPFGLGVDETKRLREVALQARLELHAVRSIVGVSMTGH